MSDSEIPQGINESSKAWFTARFAQLENCVAEAKRETVNTVNDRAASIDQNVDKVITLVEKHGLRVEHLVRTNGDQLDAIEAKLDKRAFWARMRSRLITLAVGGAIGAAAALLLA